jgi:hypothetical protein
VTCLPQLETQASQARPTGSFEFIVNDGGAIEHMRSINLLVDLVTESDSVTLSFQIQRLITDLKESTELVTDETARDLDLDHHGSALRSNWTVILYQGFQSRLSHRAEHDMQSVIIGIFGAM